MSELPIPYHESFKILDSSKVQTFMDCPRHYFYRYLLGWNSSRMNTDLVFGSAWHEAMEKLLLGLAAFGSYTEETVLIAQHAFLALLAEKEAEYTAELSEMFGLAYESPFDNTKAAKTRENGLVAIEQYARQFRYEPFTPQATELAGLLDLSEDRAITYKIDGVVLTDEGRILALEHKTTGWNFTDWSEKWGVSFQVGTYGAALAVHYPDQNDGVLVNGALIKKPLVSGISKNEFARFPVYKSTMDHRAWLAMANYWFDLIDLNMKLLSRATPKDPVLVAFPKNPYSCTKFGRCAFPEQCLAHHNPLRHLDELPRGYCISHWNPLEEQAKKSLPEP